MHVYAVYMHIRNAGTCVPLTSKLHHTGSKRSSNPTKTELQRMATANVISTTLLLQL